MNRIYRYILDGKQPVPEEDLIAWSVWFETADRKVACTEINDVVVSTVFLGLDCNMGSGNPVLFETIVSGGKHDNHMRRYSTWEQAEQGHQEMVNMINEGRSE